MSKKKNRVPKQSRTPKGTGKLVRVPASPALPPVPVKQEIGEMDWLRWRVAIQKEQGLLARKAKLQTEQAKLLIEEDNLNLRISLLRHENEHEIGHLHLRPQDKVISENGEFFIVRAPGNPIPPIPRQIPPPEDKKRDLKVVKPEEGEPKDEPEDEEPEKDEPEEDDEPKGGEEDGGDDSEDDEGEDSEESPSE